MVDPQNHMSRVSSQISAMLTRRVGKIYLTECPEMGSWARKFGSWCGALALT